MIREWLQSALTKSDPVYRKLGYVYASIALEARYSRCRKDWSSHIHACHEVIAENIPEQTSNILIVGSGPLLELPLAHLLDRCENMFLLDVVHPRKVRSWARREKKVQLLTLDMTGYAGIHHDAKSARELMFQPPQINLPQMQYVVSANVISQLSLEPYQALRKKYRWADDDFFVQLSRKMGNDHVRWLKSFGAASTLAIGDVERIYFDRDHQEVDRAPSAYQIDEGRRIKVWEWLIAPLGEVSRKFGYKMRVEARLL